MDKFFNYPIDQKERDDLILDYLPTGIVPTINHFLGYDFNNFLFFEFIKSCLESIIFPIQGIKPPSVIDRQVVEKYFLSIFKYRLRYTAKSYLPLIDGPPSYQVRGLIFFFSDNLEKLKRVGNFLTERIPKVKDELIKYHQNRYQPHEMIPIVIEDDFDYFADYIYEISYQDGTKKFESTQNISKLIELYKKDYDKINNFQLKVKVPAPSLYDDLETINVYDYIKIMIPDLPASFNKFKNYNLSMNDQFLTMLDRFIKTKSPK